VQIHHEDNPLINPKPPLIALVIATLFLGGQVLASNVSLECRLKFKHRHQLTPLENDYILTFSINPTERTVEYPTTFLRACASTKNLPDNACSCALTSEKIDCESKSSKVAKISLHDLFSVNRYTGRFEGEVIDKGAEGEALRKTMYEGYCKKYDKKKF
jgi:hypothetical protein